MKNRKSTFFIVVAITALLSYIAFFGVSIGSFNLKSVNEMRFGIDIRGGIDAAFAPKDLGRAPSGEELEAARSIIETRLDQNNILDRDVAIDLDNGYVFVRFPWKSDAESFDPDTTLAELGDMAHLTFRDPDGQIVLEGQDVANTTWQQDKSGMGLSYLVQLTLKPEGQKKFAEATERLVGQQIGIYMDEIPISMPRVESKIDSETCVINGIGTSEEARKLSMQINSGALPFALETKNYSAISPMLGSNALDIMVLAGILAFVLICLALIFYYRLSGVVASISLLLQIVGQLIMLTWPQFTITLPGIAGIILAIGMGVDANIIVAERIREEIKTGKTIPAAVSIAFKKAFSSVFDGNITVLIVAVIMLIFGSGAILSFAYTLLFGIIMNFVAGVTATRLMTTSIVEFKAFNNSKSFMSDRAKNKTGKVHPFFAKRKVYFAISAIIIAFGIVMTFVNGIQLDIQFKGGAILSYNMSEEIELDSEQAAVVAETALEGRLVTAQITTDYMTQEKRLVLNIAGAEVTSEELNSITEALQQTYPEQQFTLSQTNNVSPFFGKKFLRNGMISIVLSALLIIVYVAFSFRKMHGLSAGVMALLALFHDVIVVFFTFVVFRIPIGDSFIAVALTILGYSINDTIVIYDRIRENTRLHKNISTEELVDKSISQSFTRSLYTNVAVFISVLIVYIFAAGNGIESIRSFALPMCIGTISGCYSTICIAGPSWAMWQKHKQKKKAAAA